MSYPNKRRLTPEERFAKRLRQGRYPRLGNLRATHLGDYLATDKRDNPPKTKKIIVVILVLLALALLSFYATSIAEQMTIRSSLTFIVILMLIIVWIIGKLDK
jgi:hypothetical protein